MVGTIEEAIEKGKQYVQKVLKHGKFQFEIVTAERRVISVDVESVLLPSQDGQVGVLKDHVPIITALGIGIVEFGLKSQKSGKRLLPEVLLK